MMLLSYSECMERWQSDYQIKKRIQNGTLFRIEKGIYSDKQEVSTLAVITKKYPDSIFTLDSAFYYHGLTDVIPDEYCIATDSHSIALRDNRVKQVYVPSECLELGVMQMQRRDALFRIYDRERLLIELLRYKNKLPYDYYKDILGNYRGLLYELDIERIQVYAERFPKSKMITEALEREVF